MLTNKKVWLNAVLLGSLCYGEAAMADDRKDADAARAADKAEKAEDRASVAESKAAEKEHRAARSRRRHGKRTPVVEERVIEQPAPQPAPAENPDVNVQINNR